MTPLKIQDFDGGTIVKHRPNQYQFIRGDYSSAVYATITELLLDYEANQATARNNTVNVRPSAKSKAQKQTRKSPSKPAR